MRRSLDDVETRRLDGLRHVAYSRPSRIWKSARAGVVAPENLGYLVGVVVSVRRDAAADRGVPDVDAAVAEVVVEHPGVDHLGGERDPDAGAERIGVDRRAAGGEQEGARATLEHRVDDRRHGGDGAEHAELQVGAEIVDAGLEDRLHELASRHRGVLEHLDGAKAVSQRPDRR